jgi:hypothetical protein
MKTLSIICLATVASASAWAQQAVGNSKVNTDFSKFRTFTWAKQDLTAVDDDGYDVYYYDIEPATKHEMKREAKEEKREMKEEKREEKMEKKAEKKAERNSSASNTAMNDEPYYYSYAVIIPAQDENSNSVIKDAITNELEGRGYAENGSNGDLIVSYQVFDKRAQLHGYNNDDPVIASGEQTRTPQDTATFLLEPGSLMITLVDAKTSQVVWDGFAKNMYRNNEFITDEVKLREAVHDIFSQFKYTADKARR